MEEILRVLPTQVRRELRGMDWSELEEIRLRPEAGAVLYGPWGRRQLKAVVTGEELEQVLQLACHNSVHAVLPQLRQGYLTLRGGHRLGVCGTVRLRDGEIHAITPLSALNLRLARQIKGVGESAVAALCGNKGFSSTLILAPPGAGKTTLLRDMLRCLSDGVGGPSHRVGLADDRGEVAALWRGVPQLDVGQNTDVLEGCPKDRGMLLLLRGMNPQILAADEITAPEDVRAMSMAAGCGVALLCTAHGADRSDLERRPLYRELLGQGIFRNLLTIRMERGRRYYQREEL